MKYTLKAFIGKVPISMTPLSECYLQYFFTKTYYITITFLTPLNEFIIHPLFHCCLPKINYYWKIFKFWKIPSRIDFGMSKYGGPLNNKSIMKVYEAVSV